jgi:hypothetical protein
MKILIKKVINGWTLEYDTGRTIDCRVFTNSEDLVRCLARIVGAGGCVMCDCKPLKKEEGNEQFETNL